MNIKIGDIFTSNAKTLVNTINCVGTMGKGIALEFKKRYPLMYKEYVEMCKNGEIKAGNPYYYEDLCGNSIINFPTKDDWRMPSKLSYIKDGLEWFKNNYKELGLTSVAFPPLGCGNGGLSWDIVGPLMYFELKDIPIEIEIYAPYGTAPEKITEEYLKENITANMTDIVGNKSVKFNKNWLLLLYAVQKLNNSKYSLNVGRTIFQKLCYILTRAGIDTGFHFVEGSYGPYSKEVKEAITVLSNANYMSERKIGKMVETIVSPDFRLNFNDFSKQDIVNTEKAIDLLSRIKSTEQAEMVATVLFSYDELLKGTSKTTDIEIIDHIFKWKPHWKNNKEYEIDEAILNLSMLGWMMPELEKIRPDDFY